MVWRTQTLPGGIAAGEQKCGTQFQNKQHIWLAELAAQIVAQFPANPPESCHTAPTRTGASDAKHSTRFLPIRFQDGTLNCQEIRD